MATKAVATRELELLNSDGSSATVIVTVGGPEPFPDGGGFFCWWEIAGLETPKRLRGAGADEMQALILALKMIGATLVNSPEAKAGRLQWCGEPDLGFPS